MQFHRVSRLAAAVPRMRCGDVYVWSAIRSMAEKLSWTPDTLRRWVRQDERDHGRGPSLTTDERQRLKELERENPMLTRANQILRKASAFFAQTELDRRPK